MDPQMPQTAPTVLVVDDNPENLCVLGEVLYPHYRVLTACNGERALRLAQQDPQPDLILLDVMMPEMSGHEVLDCLKADTRTSDIPVIFVTAMNGVGDEADGLGRGAVDYIAKPLRPPVVLARVQTHLILQRARNRLRDDRAAMQALLERRTREQQVLQDTTLRALARLAETRDNETGRHILRTQAFVRELAMRLRHHPRFAGQLDDATIDAVAKAAPLHDIGKVGIPDAILRKPGPLTAEEWVVMKTHAELGAEAIRRAEEDTRQDSSFLRHAKQIARYHHERWDGRGYPDGLAGAAIPLAARLMAIADVFDALSSRRVYKAARVFDEVRMVMRAERGRHFDPEMLDVFLEGFDTFCGIARELADDEVDASSTSMTA